MRCSRDGSNDAPGDVEGVRGLPTVRAALPDNGGSDGRFVLALDEVPLAFTGPHGQSLDWIIGS